MGVLQLRAAAARELTRRIIVALDVPDLDRAVELARALRDTVGLFKIGLELFSAHGPAAVEAVRAVGTPIFLDLKLHDIPATVAGAVRAVGRLGVAMLTVHAAGGEEMLRAAVEAARSLEDPPVVLGVTVLTSLADADLDAVGLAGPPEAAVARLARLACSSGAGGLVCSPREAAALRSALGPGPLLVVPGVRPAGKELSDQKRVSTPADAVAAGADLLVIGRPITRASDPAAAARSIAVEMAESGRLA
jgi:orotidine-5'-phosphate decarboxylase